MLDNECSHALEEFFHSEAIKHQKMPAGMHRRNSAERGIRTWKSNEFCGVWSELAPLGFCIFGAAMAST